MTFKDLAEKILALPPERQKDTATVVCGEQDEAFAICRLETVDDNHPLAGVLDNGHSVIRW